MKIYVSVYWLQYITFDGPETYIELHSAKSESHLGHAIVTKKINSNNFLINNVYINIDINLPLSLTPEQFFPFVDEQLNNLLENIQP